MIIQCPDCQTRFQLDPERVPRRQIRVRCSRCRYVFAVDGRMIDEAPVPPTAESASGPTAAAPSADVPSPESSRPVEPAASSGPVSDGIGLELERPGVEGFQTAHEAATAGPPREDTPPEAPSRQDSSPAATATLEQEPEAGPVSRDEVEIEPTAPESPSAQPAAPQADADPRTKKARRLARALVSDILVYNRELRDRALAEGNLVQALGPEIKKSWELYKEKVDPEFAKESDLFRQALNDILADGQTIF